jgi:phosphatidylinositol glycan class F
MASTSPIVSSPSTSSKAPLSQQPSTTTVPQTEKAHAIDVLPTPVAQTYSHIHPTILLALYSLRFSSLVSDPVSTLWSDLPLYTGLQVTYVITCLPQAGSSYQQHSHGEAGSGEVGEVKKTPSSSGKRKRHTAGNKSDTLSQKLTVRHSPTFSSFKSRTDHT